MIKSKKDLARYLRQDQIALTGCAHFAPCQAEGIVPFFIIRQEKQDQLAFCYEWLMVADVAQLFQYLRVRDAQDGIQLHVACGRRHHSRCQYLLYDCLINLLLRKDPYRLALIELFDHFVHDSPFKMASTCSFFSYSTHPPS